MGSILDFDVALPRELVILPPAMNFWSEWTAFLRQFRSQSMTTGSVMPSSRALGRALTRPVRGMAPPRKILEVGPGTGAVTRVLVDALQPGDTLDIVEINAAFVDLINRRFADEPAFRRVREQTTVHHRPLQEMPGEAVYDFLISGIPLNNFARPLVEDIFASYRRLLKPGGTLSYFEYSGIRGMKRPFVGGTERQRLDAIHEFLTGQIARHQVEADFVLMNVPPAVARHLRFS